MDDWEKTGEWGHCQEQVILDCLSNFKGWKYYSEGWTKEPQCKLYNIEGWYKRRCPSAGLH
jgi:hypothetical protein